MFADLVKKVTFTCPCCNTSIKFDVCPGDNEIRDLYKAVNHLECPKCKNSLARSSAEAVDTIMEYNTAVSKLRALEKCIDIELD